LSRDGVWMEVRTQIKGSMIKWRWVGVGVRVGVGVVTKTSRLCEERRESNQVIDSIFELKIIHERK
jgi:hypothetical protein